MLCRMYATVKFDRPIDLDTHYISPGGYEAKFSDGRTLQFDFEEYEGGVNPDFPDTLEWVNKNPDLGCFPDIEKFDFTDFVTKFEGFEEFFIYTGEANEPEINPIKAESVTFEFYDVAKDRTYTFAVPKDKLPTFEERQLDIER